MTFIVAGTKEGMRPPRSVGLPGWNTDLPEAEASQHNQLLQREIQYQRHKQHPWKMLE
jgi:hypothetical protein